MASLIRIATHRNLQSFYSKILSDVIGCSVSRNRGDVLNFPALKFQSRPYVTDEITKSPFVANVLRIVRKEIEYQSDYAPPRQPETKFGLFTVEDRPGEQWMTMRGRFGDKEEIKVEATMFDGCEMVPRLVDGDQSLTDDVRLHLSVLVDIVKVDCDETLEFLCSAWPDRLEIQKVYLCKPGSVTSRPFMGPNFRDLDHGLQKKFREYLEARGVNDTLSHFLHEYMLNKDRIELIRWFLKLESFLEK